LGDGWRIDVAFGGVCDSLLRVLFYHCLRCTIPDRRSAFIRVLF
jgi:hypothetical protein